MRSSDEYSKETHPNKKSQTFNLQLLSPVLEIGGLYPSLRFITHLQ